MSRRGSLLTPPEHAQHKEKYSSKQLSQSNEKANKRTKRPQRPIYRRSQDFLWGALLFPKKADDLFLVVTLKTQAKTTKLSTPVVQISKSPIC